MIVFRIQASYIESAQSINTRFIERAILYGNGARAVFRINSVIHYPFQPFAYGGNMATIRSRNRRTRRTSGTTPTPSDPAGVGFAGYYGGSLGVRGEYRWAWASDTLMRDANGGEASINR
jgi:hypothetical protein